MSVDHRTIGFYDTAASRYATLNHTDKASAALCAFMKLLPPGGSVLDLGCGPGRASYHLRAAGFTPDPVDASSAMVAFAQDTHALPARLASFDDLNAVAAYDGVWANFSLLHAARHDLPRHLSAIATALRPGGVFYAGMKTGQGEARDALDRRYTYVTPSEWAVMLDDAGFSLIASREGVDKGCAGTDDAFLVTLARKT
ncbi:class I SAM-dependent methyltransferase [Loktanella sp. SALINAS62]|uniref:class I SAM-dependent DNA methyltransferase n=1 Tax=Loktanella sp. SALINAS62 TaxID=2706124 RepID=UPI0032C3E83A